MGLWSGSHEARLVRVPSGQLAHVIHGHQSVSFLIRGYILVGQISITSKRRKGEGGREERKEKETQEGKSQITSKKLCYQPHFGTPRVNDTQGSSCQEEMGHTCAKSGDAVEAQVSGDPKEAATPQD